ncbi:unnamed protein product [Clavelina lepadiformis]|uniref:3-oxo-5alpha-steroid 4-dehydrogenase (NADP(+)) n=1 Tax=Clavelina lepadiformis TaxID=159417 RepID=A0ABP0G1X9_CLALP
MADTVLWRSCLAFWPSLDEKRRVDLLASVMIDWACVAPLVIIGGLLPYGRYAVKGNKTRSFHINARLAWILQELPAFAIPLHVLMTTKRLPSVPALVLMGSFLLHYGYRALIYSFSIRGGKPSPLPFFLLAMFFCACNGYMQANYLLRHSSYPTSWFSEWNFILGMFVFLFGFYTNIRCDNILRGLRKPGETGYKIPRGWMFNYVSGGNYFGEAAEWCGWALACWSPQGLAFAVFATAFLSARSYSHHKWYLASFPNYPRNRKAFVPFLL